VLKELANKDAREFTEVPSLLVLGKSACRVMEPTKWNISDVTNANHQGISSSGNNIFTATFKSVRGEKGTVLIMY
jgi:hypothetical protein